MAAGTLSDDRIMGVFRYRYYNGQALNTMFLTDKIIIFKKYIHLYNVKKTTVTCFCLRITVPETLGGISLDIRLTSFCSCAAFVPDRLQLMVIALYAIVCSLEGSKSYPR